MWAPAKAYQKNSDGDIFDGAIVGHVHTCMGIVLTPAAAAATVTVTDADSAIVAKLSAPADGASAILCIPFQFKRKLTIDIGGVGADCVAYVL